MSGKPSKGDSRTVINVPKINAMMYDHHGRVVCPLVTTINPKTWGFQIWLPSDKGDTYRQ